LKSLPANVGIITYEKFYPIFWFYQFRLKDIVGYSKYQGQQPQPMEESLD